MQSCRYMINWEQLRKHTLTHSPRTSTVKEQAAESSESGDRAMKVTVVFPDGKSASSCLAQSGEASTYLPNQGK